MKKLFRRALGVSGIVLLVISFLIYTEDFITAFMIAFSGALIVALSLGLFGE
jgi:hypothetical protein